ncbi:hypothetical protein [Heyndrickxia oleronia]|uniref:hypothetical protein n=1 Tax=Heyndrickxia oleronia TaxID=38875 RepID=UPI001B15876C|nr:hypothetical protein [Heyndrickxia oleronia]GIN38383.1 hypothetical protein J19TS1_13320 [Heyndrickxia oleronia]
MGKDNEKFQECSQTVCCDETAESPDTWLLLETLKVATLDEDLEFRDKVKKKLEKALDL